VTDGQTPHDGIGSDYALQHVTKMNRFNIIGHKVGSNAYLTLCGTAAASSSIQPLRHNTSDCSTNEKQAAQLLLGKPTVRCYF